MHRRALLAAAFVAGCASPATPPADDAPIPPPPAREQPPEQTSSHEVAPEQRQRGPDAEPGVLASRDQARASSGRHALAHRLDAWS